MFTPGFAVWFLATILRHNHVRGVQWSRVWRKSRFLEYSISRYAAEKASDISLIGQKEVTWYLLSGRFSPLLPDSATFCIAQPYLRSQLLLPPSIQ